MIFVTVGLHDQNFDRLVRAADELATLVPEPVVIQRGCGSYIPQNSSFFDWATFAEMQEWIRKARIVVAQSGAGTIMMTLKMGKPLILAPRLSRYQENHNDHQTQLASALASQGRAVYVTELTGARLLGAVDECRHLKKTSVDSALLRTALEDKLAAWQQGMRSVRGRRS